VASEAERARDQRMNERGAQAAGAPVIVPDEFITISCVVAALAATRPGEYPDLVEAADRVPYADRRDGCLHLVQRAAPAASRSRPNPNDANDDRHGF